MAGMFNSLDLFKSKGFTLFLYGAINVKNILCNMCMFNPKNTSYRFLITACFERPGCFEFVIVCCTRE